MYFPKFGKGALLCSAMELTGKFGIFGKIMDVMIRRRTDSGTKKFFTGLKNYTEKKQYAL
jgi:hypothetical protein